MAKVSVTTNDGEVVCVFTDDYATATDTDTTLPMPNPDREKELRPWRFWVEDLLDQVRVARRMESETNEAPRTDLAQVERDRAAAQEILDLLMPNPNLGVTCDDCGRIVLAFTSIGGQRLCDGCIIRGPRVDEDDERGGRR
jgi:hypothetical protein